MKKSIIAPESKQKRAEIEEQDLDLIEDVRGTLAAHRRALQRYEQKNQYIYPLDRLVEGTPVVRNIKFPHSDDYFPEPTQALFRFCSKFYPNAKGGPLYVDEPKNDKEVVRAYERHKILKEMKIRHVVVEKDSTYEDLLTQLGEF